MIHTEDITEDLVFERFDSLPEALAQALDSENTLRIVEEICRSNNILDEEKILIVQQIAGFVLFGFIHDYDAASEINHFLGSSDPRLGQSVGEALAVKIFAPLKAELDKNYRPIPRTTPDAPVALPVAPPAPAAPTIQGGPPVAIPKIVSAIPKPPIASSLPPTTSKPPAPAPFVIHKETAFSPVQPKVAFKIVPPPPTGGQMANGKWQMAGTTGQSVAGTGGRVAAGSTARIELGKTPMPAPPPKPAVARTESEAPPRVVHYTQFSSPAGAPGEGSAVPKPPPTYNLPPPTSSGPMPLSAIGFKAPAKPPAPRPSLDVPLEKPTMPMKPPPPPPPQK